MTRSGLFLALGALMIGFLVACRQAPTKLYQTVPLREKESLEKIFNINPNTVLVDARPAFDFSLSRLNGSINLRPEDFNQKDEPFRGLIEVDKFYHARRLARYGIGPDSAVIVVGRGVQGNGEEGRVAWTLRYLGVRNVRFAAINSFSIPMTTAEAPPRPAVPLWKPQIDDSLNVTKSVFLRATKTKDSAQFLDVRSEGADGREEFAPQGSKIIQIPWREFFDERGLVSSSIAGKLEALGFVKSSPIYVISNLGIESAAVTLALRDLGFARAANFSGGYEQLRGGARQTKKRSGL